MKIPALLLEWPAAFLGHIVVVLLVWGANLLSGMFTPEPLFKPEDVMEVAMSGPPKSDSRMVQKAERAPDAARGSDAPTPPPPTQSDMNFHTPDAPPDKGQKDADAARQKIMDDLKRQQVLKDLSAPIGTQNRAASDPNGSGDGSGASEGIHDPELEKWERLVDEELKPIWKPVYSCQASPKATVDVRVVIAADGSLTDTPAVAHASGNSNIDTSAVRAIQQAGKLPPLPAKYSGRAVSITFKCANVL